MPALRELVDRAEQLAVGKGMDPNQSPLIDGEMTLEALVPHAIRSELRRRAQKGENLNELITSNVIAIAAGSGALPAGVLKECMKLATLSGRPLASFVDYQDYLGYRFTSANQLDYFALLGNTILFKEAGTASYTGNITLNVPTVPTISDATTNISLNQGVLENVIVLLVAVLTGEMKIATLLAD